MLKSILDTDILSEYLKSKATIRQLPIALQATRRPTACSPSRVSPLIYEIVYGLELKSAWAQLKKALDWLDQNEQITPTAADYLSAATIKATARNQGSVLELPDCLIAAIAARLEMPLVTGNTDDFRAIQETGIGLAIENWREA